VQHPAKKALDDLFLGGGGGGGDREYWGMVRGGGEGVGWEVDGVARDEMTLILERVSGVLILVGSTLDWRGRCHKDRDIRVNKVIRVRVIRVRVIRVRVIRVRVIRVMVIRVRVIRVLGLLEF
jgi:hypothetical protein